jgi:hypothetical protein
MELTKEMTAKPGKIGENLWASKSPKKNPGVLCQNPRA